MIFLGFGAMTSKEGGPFKTRTAGNASGAVNQGY